MGFQMVSGRNAADLLPRLPSHRIFDAAFEDRLPDEERRLVAEPDRDREAEALFISIDMEKVQKLRAMREALSEADEGPR